MSKNDNGKMGFDKFITSLAAMFKSVPDDKLADLKDSIDHVNVQDIPDMFNRAGGEHDSPSRAQIVTGPAEKMSGAGAEPMINRYSDGSAQAGLTATYERFEKILADFSKSMNASFDRRFAPLAEVVSDLVKNQQALDTFIKGFQADTDAKAVEETFLGKAMAKAEKARKAFRKAEMEEDEEEREERKSRLTEIADTLKSALKLVSKADDEDEDDEEEVEKALKTIKSLQTKVSTALTAITKAEEDEKKEEDEAEKARAAAEATAKAEETSEEEEKKDDTAKSLAAVHAQLAQVQEALKGNAVLSETVKGLMDQVMGQSKGAANLVSPPDFSVIKGGLDPEVSLTEAIDKNEISGAEALTAQTLLGRRRQVAAGNYSQDKFNADLTAAPAAVRRHFG